MLVNGWRLFVHPQFKLQFDRLFAEAERISEQHPETYKNHPKVKLLTRILQLIIEEIPDDPSHEKFNQGNKLGTDYRHWKRAKFGKDRRYRSFFRYDAQSKHAGKCKAIVYTWVNDESTLRKDGDKNDPYAIFSRRLKHGDPPDSFQELFKESTKLEILGI
jgi:toxin YhaV